MKRIFLFFGILLFFAANIALAAPVGKITYLEGKVDVLKPGKTVATPASQGDLVDVGDIYRAKSNSRAEITFIDKNILRIAQNTRTEIQEYTVEADRSKGIVKLHRGKVQAIATPDFIRKVAAFAEGNKLEIHTPNAVAGVRGTTFAVSYEGGVTWIFCLEGKVYAFNPANPGVIILIPANFISNVSDDSSPTQPMSFGKDYFETYIMPWVLQKFEKIEEIWQLSTGDVDTGLPFLTLASSASPGWSPDLSSLSFTISSNKTVSLFYSFDGSELTSTTGAVELSDASEGSHTFSYFGIDSSGNQTSVNNLDFILNRFTLAGLAHNDGSFGMSAETEGGVAAVYNQDWGGWNISLINGYYETTPSGPFQMAAGGTSSGSAGEGYWLSRMNMNASGDEDSGVLSGTSTLTHLTTTTFGTGTGIVTGTYSYCEGGEWQATDQGRYTSTPLSFVSEFYADLLETDGEGLYGIGYLEGLLGGTQSLWSGSNIPVTILGEYGIWEIDSLWFTSSPIYSYNYITDQPTTYDNPPGAFYGLAGGIEMNNVLEGKFLSLYIDPSGKAGYLKGNLSGNIYEEIGMFEMSGTVNRTEKVANIGISASDLYDNISTGSMDGRGAYLYGYFFGGGAISGQEDSGITLAIHTQPWGIYGLTLYGTHGDATSTWSAKMGGQGSFGAYSAGEGINSDQGYWIASINDGTASEGILRGLLDGKFITYTKLGEISGDLLGRYYENSWKAVSLGTWEGSPLKFFNRADDNFFYHDGEGPAFEANINAFMGGTSTLWSGSSASVSMIGAYSPGNNRGHVWTPYVNSYNIFEDNNTTIDGGAYSGYVVGVKLDAGTGTDDMEARFLALYIDPDKNAGFLRGSLTGTGNRNIGMLEMYGTIVREEKTTNIGIDPINFSDHLKGGGLGDENLLSGRYLGGGTISGEVEYSFTGAISTQTWGIYMIRLFGNSDTPTANWSAKIGSGGVFGRTWDPDEGDWGYWLLSIDDGTWDNFRMGGTASGKFITYWKMGTMDGDLLGTYNDDGTWQAVTIGTWSGNQLAFLGISHNEESLYSEFKYYDGESFTSDGYLYALMGGTSTLWSGSPVPVTMIGEYDPGWNIGHIWGTEVHAWNAYYGQNITYDYGFFYGFLGGIKLDTGEGTDNMEAKFVGLYIEPDGMRAGLLRGTLSGTGYRNISMFEMEGNITSEQKTDSLAITPWSWVFNDYGNYLREGTLSGNFQGGGIITNGSMYDAKTISILTQPWGIYNVTLYGSYSSTTGSWNANMGGEGTFGRYVLNGVHLNDDGYWLVDMGGETINNRMASNAVTGRFLTPTKLGTMDGDLLGTFNGDGTWQAVTLGTWSGTPLAFGGKIHNPVFIGNGIEGLIGGITRSPDAPSGFNVDLVLGKYDTTPSSPWIAHAGGEISFSSYNPKDRGYWLVDVSGDAWSSGVMPNITFDGIYYSPAGMGTIATTYSFDGNYYEGINMWKAENIQLTTTLYESFAGYGYLNIVYQTEGYEYIKGLLGHTSPIDVSQPESGVGLYVMGSYGYSSEGIEQAKIGGTGTSVDGLGYYFVGDVDTGEGFTFNARFLHPRYIGTIGGSISIEETCDDIGMWLGTGSLMVESSNPLKFVSAVTTDLGHTNYINDGQIEFLIGGTDTIWTASQSEPASLTAIGRYFSGANPQHLWGTRIESYNWETGYPTTYDGGAYKGFINGIEINHNFEARMVALYIDPSGNAGYLKGTLTGTGYPEINMFEMDGFIYPTQKVSSIGIAPEELTLYHPIWNPNGHVYENYAWGSVTGTIGTWGWMWMPTDYFYTHSIINPATHEAQPWGIYGFFGFGWYYNWEEATTFTAKAGGPGGFGAYYNGSGFQDDDGYWLADVDGTWEENRLFGTLTGRIITYTKLGTISGEVLGSYNDFPNFTFQAFSLGTWEGEPLAFVSEFTSNLIYFDGTNPIMGNSFPGLLGGTDTLWAATPSEPASLTIMGNYYTDWRPGHLWWSSVKSHNFINNTDTTYDDGAYRGFIGGREYNNDLEGRMVAIYVDPDGYAGYLKGSFTGTGYPYIGMFEMDGSVYPVEIYDSISGITPDNLVSSLIFNSYGLTGSGTFPAGSISINSAHSGQYKYSTPNHELAVWRNEIYGTYSGTISDTWDLSTYSNTSTYLSGTYTTGSQWSGNTLTGSTVGYAADHAKASTWISVGETLGTYNPAMTSFQAIQTGLYLETNKFLTMAGTPEGRTKLQQLNIPCVEIGRTNLTGSGGAITSMAMNNVTFFAPNSGQKPQIWATGSVNGNYSGNPLGASVNLSGGGLSAQFNVQQWNTNKWLSTITNGNAPSGIGTYGSQFNFNGAGAGTYTGTTSGTFAGTAAGVAK